MKTFLRAAFNYAFYLFGRHRFANRTPQLVVLGYHRFLPKDHPDMAFMQPAMVVSPESFDLHLRVLAEHFEFVHLDDWLRKARENKPLPKRALAITIDDGWSDNYSFALPVLKKHQVPATIFLVTDMVDTNQGFWPERMYRLLQRITPDQITTLVKQPQHDWLQSMCGLSSVSKLNEQTIDAAITAVKQLSDADIISRLDAIESDFPDNQPNRDILNWAEIETMQQGDLIRFGSHTCSHKRLDKLTQEEIKHEVLDSLPVLDQYVTHNTDVFCYPNGNKTEQAESLMRSTFIGACTTAAGWNNPDSDPYHIKRFLIHEDMSDSKVKLLASLSRAR